MVQKTSSLVGLQPLKLRQTFLSWQLTQSNNTNINVYVIIICIWTLEQAEHIAWTILPLQSFHLYKICHKRCRFSFKSFRIGLHCFKQFWEGFAWAFMGQNQLISFHFHSTWWQWMGRSDILSKINQMKSINHRFNSNNLGRITEGKIKCIVNQPLL